MSRGYLLDTHALIWWLFEAEQLSFHSFDLLSDRKIDVFVSPVSAMEIATKHRRKGMPAAAALVADFDAVVAGEAFIHLPITASHAVLAGSLPVSHKDPWDRLLVAQAVIERLTLVTRDKDMALFDVQTLW